MLDWLSFAVALLKLVNAIISWAHDRGMIDQGRQQVINEQLLAIGEKTKVRDQLREKIDAESDAQVDKDLRDLEPSSGGGT